MAERAVTGSGLSEEREPEYRALVNEWASESWPLNRAAEVLAEVFLWLDRLRADQERLNATLHFVMDEAVERWHQGELDRPEESLTAWLGLSKDEYAAWVEGRYGDFVASIAGRAGL